MVCLLGNLNEHAEASPLSLMYGLFKTIFSVSLLYWFNELHLLGYLNEHAEASLGQWWTPFKDHFLSKPSMLTWWALSLGRSEWTCGDFLPVTDKQLFQDHLLSKTIESKCRPGPWMARVESSRVSLINSLFQTIFCVTLSAQRLCLQGDKNSECAQQNLHQHQWWAAFWRPSFK